MTMFQKPKVAIAFTPAGEVEEPPFEPPLETWANKPARLWAMATLLTLLLEHAIGVTAFWPLAAVWWVAFSSGLWIFARTQALRPLTDL